MTIEALRCPQGSPLVAGTLTFGALLLVLPIAPPGHAAARNGGTSPSNLRDGYAADAVSSDTLRVVVWNVHAGTDAEGEDNLDRVAALIRETGADLVLLQEVDRGTERSGEMDQPAILARATGLAAAFGKTLDYQGGEYGIALLSRWPIRSDTLVHLPVEPAQERAGGSREPRGVLAARVTAPGGDVHVLNTHLDPGTTPDVRLQEVETLLGVAQRRSRGPVPVLMGGDLNARPGSEVLARIREEGWSDAWARCGAWTSRGPETENGQDPGSTYPASAPVRRIDYLLYDSDLRCVEARVLTSDASDHRPVYVKMVRTDSIH